VPLDGQLKFGASLKIGYFSQAHERLNPNNSVLDELLSHKQMLLGPARNYLAQYLFRGEDVFKPVRLLSGGERGRLALAILALEGANFLLLDEPSNHLDIPAQEVLQQVLEQFEGTILLVSHDRYLIDHLATQVWELHKHHLEIFEGSYAAMLLARQQAAEAEKQAAVVARSEVREDFVASKQARADERRRARVVADAEGRVHTLEVRLLELEEELHAATAAQDIAAIQRLGLAYTATQAELDAAMEAWAEVA
jgi:ATP-binding cassette subfamily F protein 3